MQLLSRKNEMLLYIIANKLLKLLYFRMEEGKSGFRILKGTPKGKRPVGWPIRRWEHNIRVHFKEVGVNSRNWIHSAQDRGFWRSLVNAVLNLGVPYVMELVS